MNNSIVKILKGKTKEEAKSLIKEAGCVCCIIQENENKGLSTSDLRQDRINLRIMNNKVIEAYIG